MTRDGFLILDFGLRSRMPQPQSKIKNLKSKISSPVLLIGFILCVAPTVVAEQQAEPSVLHGAGQVVKGVVVELPKGILEGTVDGPVVVGTMVGLLGGTVRALQVTAAGLVEMAQGFHPFEERRRR